MARGGITGVDRVCIKPILGHYFYITQSYPQARCRPTAILQRLLKLSTGCVFHHNISSYPQPSTLSIGYQQLSIA